METALLRWLLGLNVFLFFALVMCVPGVFFWGLSVGQRLGRGEPTTFFGGRVKGDVFQAPGPEAGDPAAYQAGGASAMDPLAFLDEHINRNLKQMKSKSAKRTLLDPELAGQVPSQAGRGGE